MEHDFDSCNDLANKMKQDLKSSGFFVNKDKSIWQPTKNLIWLGFVWDLNTHTLEIPSEKIQRFKNDINSLHSVSPTARQLAKITGKIIAFMPSLGNICRIMSRNMLMLISTSRYWDEQILLTPNAISEINFWHNNCELLPSKTLFSNNFLPDKIVYTDASSFAAAGYTVETFKKVVHKMWTYEEKKQKSSTYRELKAVSITLNSLMKYFHSRLVKIYTDNQNVVRIIITAGSMNSELQVLAIEIFNLCVQNNISIEVEWVPREENKLADFYSKIFDFDDWQISDIHFKYFNNLWGPFTCDVFADFNNNKVPMFFSPHWCPGTGGVDAFAYDWSLYNCWIVPPIRLISRSVLHLSKCQGKGVLVTPKWTSSVFLANHMV
ncbi:Hypothetical predicted protein [Mytilus galloprovincialis]|uniref:RNase H type-1 domain-containing protein n=1 Tax=Mytilus galloprovincialis TaxID=29158 RepID=A0A8B6GFK1_MYTGA|nr:Hypothetical predicted protein [Mytilus galloprovincialis]